MKKSRNKVTMRSSLIKKSFIPKKSFGQNFLVDPNVKRKIIAACQLDQKDIVLEIGPGKGVLTGEIAKRVKKVFAIERDVYLAERLKEKYIDSNVEIICADILAYSFDFPMYAIASSTPIPFLRHTPSITSIITSAVTLGIL